MEKFCGAARCPRKPAAAFTGAAAIFFAGAFADDDAFPAMRQGYEGRPADARSQGGFGDSPRRSYVQSAGPDQDFGTAAGDDEWLAGAADDYRDKAARCRHSLVLQASAHASAG